MSIEDRCVKRLAGLAAIFCPQRHFKVIPR